jgi:hypothetical protein
MAGGVVIGWRRHPLTPCHDTACVCPSLIRIFLVSSTLRSSLVLHCMIRHYKFAWSGTSGRQAHAAGWCAAFRDSWLGWGAKWGPDGGISSCLNPTPSCWLLSGLLGVLWWGSAVVGMPAMVVLPCLWLTVQSWNKVWEIQII